MKRKLGLMFAGILTLTILWVATTGFAWAAPASGTVPPGTGPYRVSAGLATQQAVYSLVTTRGTTKPAGTFYLISKAAFVWIYNKSTGLPVSGTVKVCGLIRKSQSGMVYQLVKKVWKPVTSTTSIKGTQKKVCTKKMVSTGKYIVIGK